MESRRLHFDAEGRPIEFSTWQRQATRYLTSQRQDGANLWAHASGAVKAPLSPDPLPTDPEPTPAAQADYDRRLPTFTATRPSAAVSVSEDTAAVSAADWQKRGKSGKKGGKGGGGGGEGGGGAGSGGGGGGSGGGGAPGGGSLGGGAGQTGPPTGGIPPGGGGGVGPQQQQPQQHQPQCLCSLHTGLTSGSGVPLVHAENSGVLRGLHIPSFTRNLLDRGITVTFVGGGRTAICTDAVTGRVLATFTREPHSGLYVLHTELSPVSTSAQVSASPQVPAPPPVVESSQVAASPPVVASGQVAASCSCRSFTHQIVLWHHCLGHPSIPRLRTMARHCLVTGLPRVFPSLPPSPAPPCTPCVAGRLRATLHSSSLRPATAPFQTLHLDNSEVTSTLIRWLLATEGTRGRRVSCLHSDRGGEFCSGILARFCDEQGIVQSWALPESPQQNGVAERHIGLVMDIAHTSMIHARAPHFLWPYTGRYAAHQLNLQPRVSRPEASPTSLWTGSPGWVSLSCLGLPCACPRHLCGQALSSRSPLCLPWFPGSLCLLVTVDSVGVGAGGAATSGTQSRGARLRGAGVGGDGVGGASSGGGGAGGPSTGGASSGGAGAGGAIAGGASSGGAEVGGPGTGGARTGGAGAGDPNPGGTLSGDTGTGGASTEETGAGGTTLRRALRLPTATTRVFRRPAGQLDLLEQQQPQQQQPPQPVVTPVSGLRTLHFPSPPLVHLQSPPAYGPTFPPPDSSPAVFPPPQSQSPPPVVPHDWTARCPPRVRPLSPLTDLHTALIRSSPRRSPPVSVLPSHPESALIASLSTPITDYYRTVRPVVSRVLASLVTDPHAFLSSISALTATVTAFASTRRLDFATRVVAAPPARPEAAGGGEWASQWKAAMDSELASWRSTGTYVDAVPPPGANVDNGMWLFKGRLHEEIWLRRPPGFTDTFPPGTQWRLRWPVYGLRQSPREWHDTLRSTLRDLGFRPSSADPSLFVRTGSTPFFILVYVDDLAFATADKAALVEVKSELQKRHTCTDLGELQRYLGLQITRDRAARTITLTKSHMVQQSSGPYAELVGCLMYLMTCTRPDLAFPLSVLSRFVATWRHRPVHWTAAVRVAKYLATTSGMGLVLGGTQPVQLTGHCDSFYADDVETQRSTRGYCFSLEIYAGAMAALELRWLTFLLANLGERPRSAPTLYADNKAMILLCREP
ncbi:unnamed protein product [Closterium sp. NIES-54]